MTNFDLGGGGGNTFSFGQMGAQPGTHISGTVLDMKEVQATDYKTKQPEFWDNGDPKMQYRVTLQTDLRDPNNPADDGKRDLYLDGRRRPNDNGTKSKLCAVLDAVRDTTGSTSLQYGGKLTLQWISGMGVTGDPRCFAAWYEAPAMRLEQPPEHRAPAPMPPAQAPGTFSQPQAQAPDWAQPQLPGTPPAPQAPPAGPPQQPVTPAVAAANPYATPLPPQQPPQANPYLQQAQAEIAQMPNPVADAWAAQQQPPAAAPPAPAAVAPPAGPPITQEQIAGIRALGQDPAAVFGPDWATRVTP